ncbi:MAG: hypothetical protein AB7F96_18145 [Beijerinckiaceae bacterium]
MLAVREQTLQPYAPCSFDPLETKDISPIATAPGTAPPIRPRCVAQDVYVPSSPVRLPGGALSNGRSAERLGESPALSEARAAFAQALNDLCKAEASLERQLADLRGFMQRRTVSATAS